MIELAADFYWEQDAEHRFTVYQPRGESDADLEGLVGKTSWELCDGPPADGGRWDRHRAALEARHAFRDVVHRFGRAAAAPRYVSVSGQPVFDAKGAFRVIGASARRHGKRGPTASRRWTRRHAFFRGRRRQRRAARRRARALRVRALERRQLLGRRGAVGPAASLRRLDQRRGSPHSVLDAGSAVPEWLGADPVFIADVAGDPRTLHPSMRVRTGWNTGLVVPIRRRSDRSQCSTSTRRESPRRIRCSCACSTRPLPSSVTSTSARSPSTVYATARSGSPLRWSSRRSASRTSTTPGASSTSTRSSARCSTTPRRSCSSSR